MIKMSKFKKFQNSKNFEIAKYFKISNLIFSSGDYEL